MPGLRELFASSKDAVWRQLAAALGGEVVPGTLGTASKVQVREKDWIITLDTGSDGDYTRLRAPFVNPDGFRFTVQRAHVFSEVAKFFGMQDIEVGIPGFDRAFVIKVGEPTEPNIRSVRALLTNERLRVLIEKQGSFTLSVKDDEGWFSRWRGCGGRSDDETLHFPDGVDELHFQSPAIKGLAQLHSLFELFSELLNHLCHLGAAYENSAELFIQTLAAPGGEIKDGSLLIWDGNTPRREAADGLAQLKDPRAVPALMKALDDADPALRVKALDALNQIGDARMVPALIAHLGCSEEVEGFPFRIRDVLRTCGEDEVVNAFNEALYGSAAGVEKLRADGRRAIIDGLLIALEAHEPKSWQAYSRYSTVVHAAEALAELGAVEALPKLRANTRILQLNDDALKVAWQGAIAKLEARGALPRPAVEAPQPMETLPRPAASNVVGTETLPREVLQE